MNIFKFGGASVKDSQAVKNVSSIIKKFSSDNLIIVVSAMGKTTNALEALVNSFFYKEGKTEKLIAEIKDYHFGIIAELFTDPANSIYKDMDAIFLSLKERLNGNPSNVYNKEYDQIVSIGEIISTKIVSAYLSYDGIKNKWINVCEVIHTDSTYREGKVDWDLTQKASEKIFRDRGIYLTQGFLGRTPDNFTTTLGREGSDYSAAILAYCTNADGVTIWKDVPGVMNADPKWFEETKLISHMSYHDAIELSYYGATVIHPKTIKPLQNKKIPLFVKSFLQPQEKGTVIREEQSVLPIPCFIFKVNQTLLSISSKDFSFIIEGNLSEIFKLFAEYGVKINVMQNSAISFSVCIDTDSRKLDQLLPKLHEHYHVLSNDTMELITVHYYDQSTIDRVCIGKKIFLEHKSRTTVQLVVKNI